VTAAAPAVEIEAVDGRARLLQRIAALLALLAIALAIGIVVLGSRGDARFRVGLDPVSFGFVGTVLAFPIVGALIVGRRPRTIVAWVMIAIGISLGTGVLAAGYGTIGVRPLVGAPFPFALEALMLSQLFFVPALGLGTTVLLLLYPTDTLLTPRWRWPAVVAAAGAVLWDIGAIFRPGELDSSSMPGLVNPLAAQPPFAALVAALPAVSNLLAVPMILLATAGLVVRYRRADRLVKAQIRWFAVFGAIVAVALAISTPNSGAIADLGFAVGVGTLPLLPIAIGIAITRYRLYDIDRLINRALVYGSLTAILAGIFTAGVGLAQRLFVAVTHETSDAAVVGATLVVATLYAPLRKRLEAVIDRRFKFEEVRFGSYRDELTRYLALTEPTRASQRLVNEAVTELDAVGGAVLDANRRVVASAGTWPVDATVRVPVPGARRVHSIEIGPRIDGNPHSERSIAMLVAVAELAAAAMDDDGEAPRGSPGRANARR
jgi:hypothetical protein